MKGEVHWKSLITGKYGHGEPLDIQTAIAWIKHENEKYGNIMKHWVQVI